MHVGGHSSHKHNIVDLPERQGVWFRATLVEITNLPLDVTIVISRDILQMHVIYRSDVTTAGEMGILAGFVVKADKFI